MSESNSISFGIALPQVFYPGSVDMALVSSFGLETPPDNRQMREEIIRLSETEGMLSVAEYAIKNNPNISQTASLGKEQENRIRQMDLALNPVGYAHSTRMILNAVFDASLPEGIKAPTIVLAGLDDGALPARRFIHERIRGSQMVVLPDAGHLSNLDRPVAFNHAVLEYLASIDQIRATGE